MAVSVFTPTRSPFHFRLVDVYGHSIKVTLTINGVAEYVLAKNFEKDGSVLFEFAELIRDFIDVDKDNVDSWSQLVNITFTVYDDFLENNNAGVVYSSYFDIIGTDGYNYFDSEDGEIQTLRAITNKVIYRLNDADVKIPINRNRAEEITYLYKGKIVRTQAITSSTTSIFQVIGTDIDSFKERVLSENGTYEDNVCIDAILGEVDLNAVDKIIISGEPVLGNKIVEVIDVVTIDECRYTPAKLSFVNRFGAVQDIWFFKKSIEKMNVSKEKYKSNIYSNFGYSNQHQYQQFNVVGNKSITLNTGYVSEDYNEPMKEILLSEKVWMEMDGKITPMNVKTNSLTFKTRANDNLVDYSLDLDYAFDMINSVR